MLLNLHKKSWMEGLTLQDYSEHCKHNETIVKEMLELAKNYNKVRLEIIQQQIIFLNFLIFFFYHTVPQYWHTVIFPPQAVEEEDKMTPEQLAIKNVGKQVDFCLYLL